MPIATQSMTKASTNLTLDAQQNPVINLSPKPVLIENSYNTNEPQTFQQQTQLQNTIDSIEKPQIYQQTHDNVPSVLPVITSNATGTNISQQSFDPLNLNVSNVNTNLPSNLNQISPKDNQITSQANSTTIQSTSNNTNNNNNNINTTNNNINLTQSSPSSASTIAGLTSIQSNSTLTTSMATISNLDHAGSNSSSQITSTTGAESINDIVDNLNVEQKSSR
jgi:hypothetical protein